LPDLPATQPESLVSAVLPGGFRVGHWTDRERWTGCTVVLAPESCVASCEVRGGGPGTRETDLLSPAAAVPGPQAVLLTGGSAFGLAAADGVVRWHEERGVGFPTRAANVPLVAAAVVYDLALGDPKARPGEDEGYAACEAARQEMPERGSIGVGTGCSVGKFLGMEHATKGGLGYVRVEIDGGATVAALAAVNALGEVVDEDGSVLAGVWEDGRYARSGDLLRERGAPERPAREATTLICVLTDARLTKTEAWLAARSASSGVARAVAPVATPYDGDVAFCLAAGTRDADPLVVAVTAADVAAAAIRDAVRQATGAPSCPAASER
jgi:L-aminopeptidase/D-esterase-like protein